MKIDEEDFKYLISMARCGADECIGYQYKYHHKKVKDIEEKYNE